jgi:hypothetical protein
MIYFKIFVRMSGAWEHFDTENKNLFLVPALPALPAVEGISAVGAGIKKSGIFANPITEIQTWHGFGKIFQSANRLYL